MNVDVDDCHGLHDQTEVRLTNTNFGSCVWLISYGDEKLLIYIASAFQLANFLYQWHSLNLFLS